MLLNFRDDLSQSDEKGNLKKSTNTKFSISEGERYQIIIIISHLIIT